MEEKTLNKDNLNAQKVNKEQVQNEVGKEGKKDSILLKPPSINLPKGGGAIKGIGEKFAANPVTGTGSLSVPIALSPGRSGFGPELSLSYDSGSGNGPFGFGWSLSLPSITRKTDKGLPQYRDAEDSDVFILSGAEDLVPEFEKDANGDWVKHEGQHVIRETIRNIDGTNYTVRRYRPRIEGLFARIERWTNQSDPNDVSWRSISKDNITTWYGKTGKSRIADPGDKKRIFSWLICQSYDDKGNAIIYEYAEEDAQRIFEDQNGQNKALTHELNRDDDNRTANRYIKRIKYGNRLPNRDHATWEATDPAGLNDWMFEVVFDYGEGHYSEQKAPDPNQHDYAVAQVNPPVDSFWPVRRDPFSSYRAGFEVRTYRLCHRVLMFHHFPDKFNGIDDYLVRSTEFTYEQSPIATFITSVIQSGYRYIENQAKYLKKSLPPLEFEYSQAIIQKKIKEIDDESLENLPIGLDGNQYQWVDLDGESISGILTEQADSWFYKPNLGNGHFGPMEAVASQPSPAALSSGRQQLLDLAGDGQLDLVQFIGPTTGFYERTHDRHWENFMPFSQLPNVNWDDPNLRFVDLNGDGHADILITEDEVMTWYPSLAEEGFDPAESVYKSLDEEKGPRLVFADGTQSIYLADLSGDGLTDLARIRNGEVCYWPSLGYGRFGAKLTMDNAPWFDLPDQFDQRRIRTADIDGSGTTDILYLGHDTISIYRNHSGNCWGAPETITNFFPVDNLSSVTAADLLGNGTACLVWSSPLPGDVRQPMKYMNLMGEQKPHLLKTVRNNLGAKTVVHYAPSTKFYLDDKKAGKHWVTRIPFPVHVVERVVTYDHISRNRFVTRYAYHHGYFDGEEREFRGFGMVEQWDTEEFAVFEADGMLENTDNWEKASHVPPVLTKTWFHTGVYLGRQHVSDFFSGLLDENDVGEYYREPVLDDLQAQQLLLPDTILPTGLSLLEEREACRALKGAMLRQEVYAVDGTEKAKHPYTITEQNFTICPVQPRKTNKHGVFFTHPREAISYHYERNPADLPDPRIAHTLTLEVDRYGNVLKSASIAYGRRQDSVDDDLSSEDREKQKLIHITCTENSFTRPYVEGAGTPGQTDSKAIDGPDAYRTPLPAESRTYELRKAEQEQSPTGQTVLFRFDDMLANVTQAGDGKHDIEYEDLEFTRANEIVSNDPTQSDTYFRRLIEHVRTLYRPDDIGVSTNDSLQLLPLFTLQSLALTGETYKLVFTPGLLDQVFQRGSQPLLTNPADVLPVDGPRNKAADRGGYVDLNNDGHWWIPSGRMFYSPSSSDTPPDELSHARNHFFLPHRYRDPFHTPGANIESVVTYDNDNLLMLETRDALDNLVTVGERKRDGTVDPLRPRNDYRVLQPRLITDPNGNRTEVVFDALGMVAGTAVMGKPEDDPKQGDYLDDNFMVDLPDADVDAFYDDDDPHAPAQQHLSTATTRIIYNLDRFYKTYRAPPQEPEKWEPVFAATLARETHVSDLSNGDETKIQISFSYSDGFGREIQKKIQAEPENPDEPLRWVGSGWTIFNNKGKPVRQYEPFFSQLIEKPHHFEFGVKAGVSPILFYDPLERVIATLHPNHTYEKVLFDPWQQTTYDVNDTCALLNQQTGDPRTDPDIQGYVNEYFKTQPATWQTWHVQRIGGGLGPDERNAALRAEAHADTPNTAHFDTLGRPFLTVARNRVICIDHDLDGTEESFATRVELDIEGNQREVHDERKLPVNYLPTGALEQRIIMRYAYDMLGNQIHQTSMEAGERWMLNDVAGQPIRAWDSRGHNFKTAFDILRRPIEQYVRGTFTDPDPLKPNSDPRTLDHEIMVDKIEYGESVANAEALNLRTQIFRHFDSAGVVINARFDEGGNPTEAYDFKGNLLGSTRRLAIDYKAIPEWQLPPDPQLEAESFKGSTRYDALNRPIQSIAPHSSLARAKRNVIQPVFNKANLLDRVDVWLERAAEPSTLLDPDVEAPSPVGVANIDYDPKGQRMRIDYKNGATTLYTYDPDTFRLIHLKTVRGQKTSADCTPIINPRTCEDPPAVCTHLATKKCIVQDLKYTYDPAGNITHIQDDAQQTIYFSNRRVEPSNDYVYDALYRLVQATGREHLGQTGGVVNPPTALDAFNSFHTRQDHPGDGNVMGTYIERYVYDAVGNFLQMQHRGSDPVHPGWTRRYTYNETSLIEGGKQSNRLSRTQVGNGTAAALEAYLHDVHGNMIRMPHLGGGSPGPNMHWDYKDQLRQIDRGVGGIAFYVYDAAGKRVRKVWEKSPSLIEERTYLGSFEIYRKHSGPIGVNTTTLERETLHVMDDKQRIALVETRSLDTAGDDKAPRQLIRYQFGNHLGSACLELDEGAQIISYEEYTPYGSSTYQAVRSQTEMAKRYRYTGKERDEESGLYYYGARYYASFLGRWIACDPIGLKDDINSYRFARGNPALYSDPSGTQNMIDSLIASRNITYSEREEAAQACLPEEHIFKITDIPHQEPTISAPLPLTRHQKMYQKFMAHRAETPYEKALRRNLPVTLELQTAHTEYMNKYSEAWQEYAEAWQQYETKLRDWELKYASEIEIRKWELKYADVPRTNQPIQPSDLGFSTIHDNPRLRQMWQEAICLAENAQRLNAHQRLMSGESIAKDPLRASFGTVEGYFLRIARGAGYNIHSVHHWNWPLGVYGTDYLNPRHLVPMRTWQEHIRTHALTGTDPKHPIERPINPFNVIRPPEPTRPRPPRPQPPRIPQVPTPEEVESRVQRREEFRREIRRL